MASQTNGPNPNASLHVYSAAAKDSKAMDACGMTYRQMTG